MKQAKELVYIKGLRKDQVLLALYEHAQNYYPSLVNGEIANGTIDAANRLIGITASFAFREVDLGGGERSLYVDITRDHFDPTYYDSKNSHPGLASVAISELREKLQNEYRSPSMRF